MHPANFFLFAALSFIAGIFLASFFAFSLLGVSVICGIAAGFLFALFKFKRARFILILILFFTLGLLRFGLVAPPTQHLNDSSSGFEFLSYPKQVMRQGISSTLSPPQSSIMRAMVLGEKEALAYDTREVLAKAGIIHITAVSGMHVAIIGSFIFGLLGILGILRRKAAIWTILFLVFYVIFIGAPPSAVRAGIMGAALFAGEALGRPRDSSRALVLAGALMLAHNPLLLRYDISFQLSFSAVLGIIYLMPRIEKMFSFLPGLLGGRKILAMTLAAQIGTFPFILYYFGQVSLAAPLANLAIVPILPETLIAGLVTAFGGFLPQIVNDFLSWPAWLLSSLIWQLASLFSNFPTFPSIFQYL